LQLASCTVPIFHLYFSFHIMKKFLNGSKSSTTPPKHASTNEPSGNSPPFQLEKAASTGHLKVPKEDHAIIAINRSDGISHDLQNVLSGLSGMSMSSRTIGTPDSNLSSRSFAAVEDEAETTTISVARSDGLSHDIIKVFKAESDAKGETLRIKSRQPSVAKIQLDPSLSTSCIYFPKSVRIVHMSDTHNFLTYGKTAKNKDFLPSGDILVHSGDFTNGGSDEEYAIFNQWLGLVASQKYLYRIVVVGSRDVKMLGSDWDGIRKRLSNATHVLCHSEATVLGLRFYGSPWHWGHLSNYAVRPGAPSSTSGRFDEIPDGIHVLVTHGPAFERLDRVQTYIALDGSSAIPKTNSANAAVSRKEEHWGSRELADNIRRVRPGLHLHGHVKDARGVLTAFAHQPLTVNSAMCDRATKVMYGCPHVIKATQIYVSEVTAATGGTNWSFEMDFLD